MSKKIDYQKLYQQEKDSHVETRKQFHIEIEELREDLKNADNNVLRAAEQMSVPVRLVLFCPSCHARHIDSGAWAIKEHHTHACQSCGFVWRPAVVNTFGVKYLPGFIDSP